MLLSALNRQSMIQRGVAVGKQDAFNSDGAALVVGESDRVYPICNLAGKLGHIRANGHRPALYGGEKTAGLKLGFGILEKLCDQSPADSLVCSCHAVAERSAYHVSFDRAKLENFRGDLSGHDEAKNC